jgi:hypothetical protein
LRLRNPRLINVWAIAAIAAASLLAAPELLLGWDRAAVATEVARGTGPESPKTAWPLFVVTSLFLLSIVRAGKNALIDNRRHS